MVRRVFGTSKMGRKVFKSSSLSYFWSLLLGFLCVVDCLKTFQPILDVPKKISALSEWTEFSHLLQIANELKCVVK
jgi:ABC-type uncharacterized transport system permease subunit